jgi:ribosomal protein L11 methyltransferase
VWYQLQIQDSNPFDVEQLGNDLEEMGALSVTFTDKCDNPVFEPELGTTPLWPEVIVQALFDQEIYLNQSLEQLKLKHPSFSFATSVLEEQDWERVWMTEFKPKRFGQHLWICPTWADAPDPKAINLILDPGLAFGTGTHPTTELCLTWLDKADLDGKTLIDYGCGSGILALAAVKLGAREVFAVDIDPQALQATENNAHTNGISQLHIDFPQNLQKPVDIILANILLSPLISLADRFNILINNQGKLVISGLLKEQVPILLESYKSYFIAEETYYLEDWALIVLVRV